MWFANNIRVHGELPLCSRKKQTITKPTETYKRSEEKKILEIKYSCWITDLIYISTDVIAMSAIDTKNTNTYGKRAVGKEVQVNTCNLYLPVNLLFPFGFLVSVYCKKSLRDSTVLLSLRVLTAQLLFARSLSRVSHCLISVFVSYKYCMTIREYCTTIKRRLASLLTLFTMKLIAYFPTKAYCGIHSGFVRTPLATRLQLAHWFDFCNYLHPRLNCCNTHSILLE